MNYQLIKLFTVGLIQLIFMAAGTYYISKENYVMMFVSCLVTNVIFSLAIKILAFSNWIDRIIYSLGCALGCILGVYLASNIF